MTIEKGEFLNDDGKSAMMTMIHGLCSRLGLQQPERHGCQQ